MATTAASLDTALQCFAAIARHHGLDLAVDRLRHDHALKPDENGAAAVARIARANGFRGRRIAVDWNDLPRFQAAFPAIAELENGNCVIVAGIRRDEGGAKVLVLDPLADPPGGLLLDADSFCRGWKGRLLLLKRRHAITDASQPFGFGWFVPETLRHRALFRDVGIAALALNVLALAVPIFVQIMLDKVLVHQAYTTLYVLTAGVCLAIAFDAAFGYLRRYLLLHATSKLDIRTATRTFDRLLSLPIGFFERASAGVIVKHMQQADKIPEFLTGRLFLTLLDATALLVVVPLLLLYSPGLTALVLAVSGLMAVVIGLLIGPFRRRLRALYEAEGQRQAYLTETIHGMETVKALAIEPARRRD